VLSRVVAVKIQYLVSVRFLTVDLCVNRAVVSSCQQNVKESKLVVTFFFFFREFYIFCSIVDSKCKMS
jgi:hypothetical protein